MKKLVFAAALAVISMPALAQLGGNQPGGWYSPPKYKPPLSRLDLDFGESGVYFNTAGHSSFCSTALCLQKMVAAKMVLDYSIRDELKVSVLPATVVFTMADKSRYPATGACTNSDSKIVCALDHKSYGMELILDSTLKTGTGLIWHGSIDGADKFTFTWKVHGT